MIELKALCTLFVELGEPRELGDHPSGQRRIIPITGGTFSGEQLSGKVLPIGADWQTVWTDGTAQLDTRYALETDDGATIEISNFGYRYGDADALRRLSRGENVDPALYSMRTQARFQTGDHRYSWLNRTLAAGIGIRHPNSVEIALFEMA